MSAAALKRFDALDVLLALFFPIQNNGKPELFQQTYEACAAFACKLGRPSQRYLPGDEEVDRQSDTNLPRPIAG